MINWLINRTCIHAFASLFFGLFTELSNNCKRNININLHKLADWSMTTTELTKANFGFLNIYFPFNLAHSGVGSVNHRTMRFTHTHTSTESIFRNHQTVGTLKLFLQLNSGNRFYYAWTHLASCLAKRRSLSTNRKSDVKWIRMKKSLEKLKTHFSEKSTWYSMDFQRKRNSLFGLSLRIGNIPNLLFIVCV